MAPAVDRLARLAVSVSTHDARARLISNQDGQVVHHGTEVLRRIVSQVSNPVRWDLCMQTMRDLGVTGILEVPPAGALTGIAKRALKGVDTFALKSPDMLDDAHAFVAKHAEGAGSLNTTPTWRLLVAPAKGTFHVEGDLASGTHLSAMQTVGAVHSLRDQIPIVAPHGGTVVEMLVEDGDLVAPGMPLIRLHPEAAE